jgi:hypothetical protein
MLGYTQTIQQIVSDAEVTSSAYFFKEQKPFYYYDFYNDVLSKHVDQNGLVDYSSLKDNENLDIFFFSLSRLPYDVYNKYSYKQKKAFWINVYNAMGLKIMADHYPIKEYRNKKYNINSIKQIPGAFKKIKFNIMGKKLSLDNVENQILRREFADAKLNFVLSPCSMSGPPLRNEPYRANILDLQLTDQAAKFLKNRNNFKIDIDNSVVYISPIFKWHLKDFENKYGDNKAYTRFNRDDATLLNFVHKYLDSSSKAYIYSKSFNIDFLDYNWTLNSQTSSAKHNYKSQKASHQVKF